MKRVLLIFLVFLLLPTYVAAQPIEYEHEYIQEIIEPEEEEYIPFPTGTLILLLVSVIGAITVGAVYGVIVTRMRRR